MKTGQTGSAPVPHAGVDERYYAKEEQRKHLNELQREVNSGNQEFVFADFCVLAKTYLSVFRMLGFLLFLGSGVGLLIACVSLNADENLGMGAIKHDVATWVNSVCHRRLEVQTGGADLAALAGLGDDAGGGAGGGQTMQVNGADAKDPAVAATAFARGNAHASDVHCIGDISYRVGEYMRTPDISFLNDTHQAPRLIQDAASPVRLLYMGVTMPSTLKLGRFKLKLDPGVVEIFDRTPPAFSLPCIPPPPHQTTRIQVPPAPTWPTGAAARAARAAR